MKRILKVFFVIAAILALFVVCWAITPHYTDKLQYFFDGFRSTMFSV